MNHHTVPDLVDGAPSRFAAPAPAHDATRRGIAAACRLPEPDAVATLLPQARLPPEQAQAAGDLAAALALALRERGVEAGRAGLVQGLIQQFSLSSQEGVALMCLAEALLRIPDAATRDALIRDKIADADWQAHLGQSRSVFVNAATWGLLITGKLVATHSEAGLAGALARIVARSGEPLIRLGVDHAMRLMGDQFVCGETIGQALRRAQVRERQGFTHSYDMLGEAAMTDADARRYLQAYDDAIRAIGAASCGRGVIHGPGISVKLSALHPRYSRAQRGRVLAELYPRLLQLARLAKQFDIGLNIDAEEADRLEISLDLLEALCLEDALQGWNGIGFVVQAYQKRALVVVEHLVALARRTGRRLMVRLVKGAYWDSEIKRAHVDGQTDYPVFTRKVHTDVSYLACARQLLAAPDAVYPQFATHNAHTLAAIHTMAGPNWRPGQYEFQCLHGMGEPLYKRVVASAAEGGLARPCRIYAPVGSHETLLAYLVRRLLENGANSSFVNRVADPAVPLAELVADPVDYVLRSAVADGAVGLPHPLIPLPGELYGAGRRNSVGIDLADEAVLAELGDALVRSMAASADAVTVVAAPVVDGIARRDGLRSAVRNPADPRDGVGWVHGSAPQDIADALDSACRQAAAVVASGSLGPVDATPPWPLRSADDRAAVLDRAADAIATGMNEVFALLVREAGKTAANAVGEWREAIDFLRYGAAQARRDQPRPSAGAGPVVCISPWNFPLAIFIGQIATALAAGRVVLAKPAEQTPLVAAWAVARLHAAGVPPAALQLLPGPGETVGAALVADVRIGGVMFTGSTAVAQLLQRQLAGRLDADGQPLTLVAETGGRNAMIVDSSALTEQVVADIVASAFDSAGQRCSALRLLCLQTDIAERVLLMLDGALHELALGLPAELATDVGPVIDDDARSAIEAHVAAMQAAGRPVRRFGVDAAGALPGCFVAPTVIEIYSVADLDQEVFGPVLHVLRWRRDELAGLIAQINATGYGLTLGLHTRINETIALVSERARVGNVYVNRNMVGAVVGVQPFGGEGWSGTGPKAGGPLALRRWAAPTTQPARGFEAGVGATPDAWAEHPRHPMLEALHALRRWLATHDAGAAGLVQACDAFELASPVGLGFVLNGPTGERNTWRALPRDAVLCVADDGDDRLFLLAAVLACGSRAVWNDDATSAALIGRLPEAVRSRIAVVADPVRHPPVDAALVMAGGDAVARLSRQLADRDGPIVGLLAGPPGGRDPARWPPDRLLVERTLSVNTAAAGGNASLMTM